MVAIAHLRLRLTILERHPELLDMQIQRPMELAGLKSRLARAKKQEASIAEVGKRYDAVMDKIDELTGAGVDHVGSMEQYEADLRNTIEGMVAGGNGGPPLEGEDGQTGPDQVVDTPVAQQSASQATVAHTPAQPSTEHSTRWP